MYSYEPLLCTKKAPQEQAGARGLMKILWKLVEIMETRGGGRGIMETPKPIPVNPLAGFFLWLKI